MLLDSDQDGVKVTPHFANSEEGSTYTYTYTYYQSELLSMYDVG